jgi:beta-galactosidase
MQRRGGAIAVMVRDWDCFAWAVESVALVCEYDIHMPLPNMRTALKIGWLLVGTCALFTIRPIWAAESPRERVSLDANWRFHLGDDWPDALHLDKAGTGSGAAAAEFAAELTWRNVNVPHDWAVELPFDRTGDRNHGFKPLGPGFEGNSIAWYRRTFELPAEDSGKRIWLTFDGVFRDATVWVNGWLVRRHEGGYDKFREDITDVVKYGGNNVVAVRVDATKFEGWFYEGAGIYRHVWLDKTAPVAIVPDGIFVYSKFKENLPAEDAEIYVEASVLNKLTNDVTTAVDCEIISPEGKSVAGFNKSMEVPGQSQATVKLESKLSLPDLWSPESPKLYKLVATVAVGGKIVDRLETAFGVRTLGFDPATGFLLNGKRYELHGTCNHQDHAGVGTAVPDALQAFRVMQLKKFGCNAIRSAHNPPTPELLDVCDRLGMLVMDESRLLGSDSENLRKWDELIRRDRNHPCVAIWSIANEEVQVQDSPQAAAVALTMQNYVKRRDTTRPVTYAAPQGNVFRGINSLVDVRGWNYNYGPCMDDYHAEHPEQPNVGTEQASVVGTRGVYANDWPRGYVSAYDVVWPGWQATAESWWSYFADRPWLSGGFAWTGFDYRGEPSPCIWPCISSQFGILDTCGFPKDAAYYYESWWSTDTVLHLTPHWNWPGKLGQEIRVEAQSNCKKLELFLNGNSLGSYAMKPNSKLVWQVKYAPGTLSAKGFDGHGHVIAETKVETTGPPAQIQLTPDRKTINADGKDVDVFTVAALDTQGRLAPLAQNKIDFAISGAGRIIGVGNGDPACHEPDTFVPARRTIAVGDWRWKLATFTTSEGGTAPQNAAERDDSSWNVAKSSEMPLKENETAIYRAQFKLRQEDLDGSNVYICFETIDDSGWIFVNNQFVGESHSCQTQSVFEIKKHLRAGDNLVSVRVKNDGGWGGINPRVNVIACQQEVAPWSRSLFNGLAQVIVQSTPEAGEFRLTASSDGLAPTTAVVPTQPCTFR